MNSIKYKERKIRAQKMVRYLKKTYPTPSSELLYEKPFQFLVSVILSAQCTDKAVNKLTHTLFKKYKKSDDFAKLSLVTFAKEISSIPLFNNKAKAIIGSAKIITNEYNGKVPNTEKELTTLPGVGYKTAHVMLGEIYGIWSGIATDTHVKRFARKLDLTDNTDLMKISKDLEELIPKKDWKYVNNGLVLYGRYVCSARPHDCVDHTLTKLWLPSALRWPKAK